MTEACGTGDDGGVVGVKLGATDIELLTYKYRLLKLRCVRLIFAIAHTAPDSGLSENISDEVFYPSKETLLRLRFCLVTM
jgi:hypothetical protein